MSLNIQLFNATTVEEVRDLIRRGADVNAVFIDGESTLRRAVFENNLPMVHFLVQQGANVNAEDFLGGTPLHVAVFKNNLDLVKFLVQHGANVNAAEKMIGDTPLHQGVVKTNLAMVRFLVQHGADVNAADRHNNTPLSLAIRKGNRQIAEFLIDNGAILDDRSLIELKKRSPTFKRTLISNLYNPRVELTGRGMGSRFIPPPRPFTIIGSIPAPLGTPDLSRSLPFNVPRRPSAGQKKVFKRSKSKVLHRSRPRRKVSRKNVSSKKRVSRNKK